MVAAACKPQGSGTDPLNLTCVWSGSCTWQNTVLGDARPDGGAAFPRLAPALTVFPPARKLSKVPPADCSTLPFRSQLSNTARPVLTPPPSLIPCARRAFTDRSTPCQ